MDVCRHAPPRRWIHVRIDFSGSGGGLGCLSGLEQIDRADDIQPGQYGHVSCPRICGDTGRGGTGSCGDEPREQLFLRDPTTRSISAHGTIRPLI